MAPICSSLLGKLECTQFNDPYSLDFQPNPLSFPCYLARIATAVDNELATQSSFVFLTQSSMYAWSQSSPIQHASPLNPYANSANQNALTVLTPNITYPVLITA